MMCMMPKTLNLFFLLAVLYISVSCSSKQETHQEKEKEAKSYLPKAAGEPNALLVVMDTADWNGQLGEAIRSVFSEYVPGLPQDEPFFKVRNINPLKFNSIIQRATNLIFVHTLDSKGRQSYQMEKYYGKSSLQKIKEDSSLFMRPQQNIYAKGQSALHLFGQTKEQLIHHIEANQKTLLYYFAKAENGRMAKKLFKVREKKIEKRLENEYDFTLNIPYGFEVAKALKDFVWVRQLDPGSDSEKAIFVHFRPYDSKEPFDDVFAHRESITSLYLRDIEKPEIYMTLQDTLGHIQEINFKGKYAKEARGLWKNSDISAGGPFLSYVFVDEGQKRLYYLEGYVYNPGGDKRVLLQEMEIILQTFMSDLSI